MGFDLLLLAPVGSILALGFAFYLALSIILLHHIFMILKL